MVIFDLDGTLLDTLADVANAVNATLREGGYPEHPVADCRYLLGGGVRRLFEAALPPDARSSEQIERSVATFVTHYDRNWNATTRPYDGIPELVAELRERDLQQAVLSNKPHRFTRQCIAAHFGNEAAGTADDGLGPPIGPFARVVGQRDAVPPKPDPSGALEIADALGVTPAEVLYVGDTSIDMETGRRAGMRPIGVLWGFRDRAELEEAGAECVIGEPSDLLSLLTE